MSLILRRDKGSKLTITELDNNFEFLSKNTGDLTFIGLTMSSQIIDKDVTLVTKGEGSFVIQNDNNGSWVLNLGIKFNDYNDVWGSSVTTDELGNTYTTGGDYNSERGFIIKTNKVGEVIWQKTITQYSYGESIVYKNGKLFVLLTEDGNGSGILILKLDTDGILLDQWSFQPIAGVQPIGVEIDVDEDENVYWTGQQVNKDTGYYDIVVGKLNTLSNIIEWSYSIDGYSSHDYGYSIKYKSGFIYIASSANQIYYTSLDLNINSALIIKLDLDGDIIWNTAVAITTGYQEGDSIVVDNDDNVYVVGSKRSEYDTNTGNFILKLNSSGSIVWVKSFILLSTGITSIDYNEEDNHLYITTYYNDDIFISKISTDGDIIWQNVIGTNFGEYMWYDNGHKSIKVTDNQIYLTGYTYASDNSYSNMFLLSYSKDSMTPSTYGDWTILSASFSFTTPIDQLEIDKSIYIGCTSSDPSLTTNLTEQTFIKSSFKIIDSKVYNYGGTYSTISYDSELTDFSTKKTQLKVKGEINVNDLYTLPESEGKSGEVLSYPETGNVLKWGKPGTAIATDDFISPSTLNNNATKFGETEGLTQVVGQLETIIVTLTNYDIADNIGGLYTINRRNGDAVISDSFFYDDYPNVSWSNTSVELLNEDNYTRQFKITCTDYNSSENSVVTIDASGGLSASIVLNQGYANSLGFDNDFVEIDLKDYPYYPYTPASFDQGVFGRTFGAFDASVECTYIQSDGKILVGGSFNSYNFYSNSVHSNYIIRLNSDGSPDKSFNITTGFDDSVLTIKQQSDGKILVGGNFTLYQGVTHSNIIRLNLDGTIDTTFNSGTGFDNSVRIIEIQPDGKILVGGNFLNYDGTSATNIVRLDSNGLHDSTFVYGLGFSGGEKRKYINTIKYLSIDKILVGGAFGSYNGQSTTNLVSLNTDGTLDTNFVVGGTVEVIEEQTDGRILIGGAFNSYNGYSFSGLVRLLPYSYWNDINLIDFNFNNGGTTLFNSAVRTIKQQSDGKILVGGDFTQYNDYNEGWYDCPYLARLNSNGSFDSNFDTTILNLNSSVKSISIQSDNKIILGGNFDSQSYLARLYSGLEAKYFNLEFLGETYDKIGISSNSYLTFGGGSSQYDGLEYNNPNLPGIFISAGDRSYQRVWVGTYELKNIGQWVLKVRYEGGENTQLDMNIKYEIAWEISFFDKEQYDYPSIDVKIDVNKPYNGPDTDYGMALIKGSDFSVKSFLPIPESSFILPNGWGLKETKYETIQFNPGTTVEELDKYKIGKVNLPVAAADWTNNSGNVWGLRTYNGGTQFELSSGSLFTWFDFTQIPGYVYSNLRGGIIEYHAFTSGNCNGTIIGSITFVLDSNNTTNIIHSEVYSGSNMTNIELWRDNNLYSNPGSIQVCDTSGGTTQLMIQWTSRLFFGSEYYDY